MVNGKRGGIGDIIFIVVVLLALSVGSIVVWKVFKQIDDDFQTGSVLSSEGKSISSSLRGKYVNIVDSAFLFLFVGLFIAIVIGAWFIKVHPALFWVSIPILAFIVFLAAIYGNFFQEFKSTTDFAVEAADFSIMNFIMSNFVYVITIVVLITSLALFAKNTGNEF